MIWIFNIRKAKNLLLILLAAFIAALILYIQKQDISVFVPVREHGALAHVETSQKRLALTFDSNWGTNQIQTILETLKSEKIKATFFFSGEWAERHPELVRRAIRDGHEVESQGMRHEDYTQLSTQQIRRDLLLSADAIFKAGGVRPVLIRPPYGKISTDFLNQASALQLQPVLWNVYPHDDANPGYAEIVRNVLRTAGKGSIIRLHASDSAKQTDRALPLIIRELENRGFTFVTLQGLISDSKSREHLLN
ncbi:polysaccharide deacetylase family protein [Sporolactobacillus vineae]|uniref:polysaccharide deacetylase family protein n=1 Tax=Sporolactobacillus vineae TaxID=444463 RepID=UPI000289D0BA|nr:polysaccharide deacetylase family protein [Sporolactobacillus vineae]